MKIDVMMMTSQTCGEDDPKSPSPSPSPLTSRQEDSKARQRRWAAVSECRLAEQVEAEKVLLSSDINGLKNQGDWKAGRGGGGGGGGEHLGEEDTCHVNKLGVGDELFWTNASDDDTGNIGGVASAEDFHTMHDGSLLVHSRNVAASVVGIPRYLVGGGPRVSCTPPSPGEEKHLDGSPMEADITEFFPAVRRVAASLDASMKKQGMSPRQRLLYRYRMEEMLMTQENNEEEEDMTGDISGEDMTGDISGDGSALLSLSSSFEPTTSSETGAGLEAKSSGFAQSSPGSPYSWNASASGSVGGHPDCSLDESSERGFLSADGLLRDCHICGYAPCSREDYDSHMKRTHFTHKCHLCVYWSRSPGRLNRHMKTFHGEPNTADASANRKPKNPRKYACKQCDFFTYIQEEIWNHTRVHVPASKLLSCPHCPFVCAFKHHMQYHVNNHLGHKPFRCSDCNYRCNNKSMLNSHRKSHSNDYPYRCGVCNYAAKYRHALNIHLRKKRHFADGEVVLEDGPRYIGARSRNRGGCTMATTSRDSRTSSSERRRRSSPREEEEEEIVGQHDLAWRQESQHDGGRGMTDCNDVVVKQEPGTVNHSVDTSYLQAVHRNAMYGLADGAVRPASLVPISDLSNVQLMRYSPVVYPPRTTTTTTVAARNGVVPPPPGRYNAASIPGVSGSSVLSSLGDLDHSSLYETTTLRLPVRGLSSSSPGRRFPVRVGGANYRTVDTGLEQDPPSTPGRRPFDALQDCGGRGEPAGGGGKAEWPLDLTSKPSRNTASTENSNNNNNNNNNYHRNSWRSLPERVPRPCRYECQHCGIIFPDLSLYSMHMEYHGHPDPFRCNLCGQGTNNRREFFNHINQVAHKSAI